MRCQFRHVNQTHCRKQAKLSVSFEFYNETFCYAVCPHHASVIMGMKINPVLSDLSAYARFIAREV